MKIYFKQIYTYLLNMLGYKLSIIWITFYKHLISLNKVCDMLLIPFGRINEQNNALFYQ